MAGFRSGLPLTRFSLDLFGTPERGHGLWLWIISWWCDTTKIKVEIWGSACQRWFLLYSGSSEVVGCLLLICVDLGLEVGSPCVVGLVGRIWAFGSDSVIQRLSWCISLIISLTISEVARSPPSWIGSLWSYSRIWLKFLLNMTGCFIRLVIDLWDLWLCWFICW